MQLIPAIDLLGEDAVRLERGAYDHVLFRRPIDDFLARVVATAPSLIHVVDLQGARDGALRLEMVRRCVAIAGDIPVQASGGIRSIEMANAALGAGAARVIVGTAVWSTPTSMTDYVRALDKRLVVAFDVREGHIAVRGWQSATAIGIDEALERCVLSGVRRLHVTAIERDGILNGPDLALYERVCASGLAVVAAGGVRDEHDLDELAQLGCEGAVMGLGYFAHLGLSPE
ncbi:MAG TPA: HisA/HisF-related TIM barrel protein [Acidimicrobiales bacterium]|nr:HisA/HisF-related TIM barrel protein [Acidimicrobiales bacterium]